MLYSPITYRNSIDQLWRMYIYIIYICTYFTYVLQLHLPISYRRIDWSILIKLHIWLHIIDIIERFFFGTHISYPVISPLRYPLTPLNQLLSDQVLATDVVFIEDGRRRKRPNDVVETTSNGGVFRALWMEQGQFHQSFFHGGIHQSYTGWWFGTFFIFPYIGNTHPNWQTHIFQKARYTTNQ